MLKYIKKRCDSMKKIYSVNKINKMRSIAGLVTCSIIFILNLTALLLNVANVYDTHNPESGLGTLRMFTTLSCLFVSTTAILCIPFQIQGIRYNNYHLPNWIVDLMYVGVSIIALTFMMAISAISIINGPYEALVARSNIFMHTLIPIFSILLFTLINSDHHIKAFKTIYAMIPIFIYSIVYFIMAIAIGEDNGGWRDVYGFNRFLPWPVSLIIVMTVAILSTTLLRILHNKNHQRRKKAIYNYYALSDDFKFDSINEAIKKLAMDNKKYYFGGYIEIPTKSIKALKDRYNSSLNDDELYVIYLKEFMNK